MKNHIWKVFEFSGWFILLVGIIFGLLYASMTFQAELVGGIILIAVGLVFVLTCNWTYLDDYSVLCNV
jgi:hypothetical protein